MPHEFLATVPFDLADLHVFHLLADAGSFTLAARRAGLTQSSLTRRIQAMEEKLGVPLVERTTRRVSLSPAGAFLREQTRRLITDVDVLLKRFAEEHAQARREVKVGVSRSISLAHLPGLFAANQRHQPDLLTRVTHADSANLLEALDHRELDLGILCPPPRLPASLGITHRFQDNFVFIAPKTLPLPAAKPGTQRYRQWLLTQRWLMLAPNTQTARVMKQWLEEQDLPLEPTMQLDSFDVIIHLVAMDMGVALVPQRALAAFTRKRSLQRLPWKTRFFRELVVISRKDKNPPEHLRRFVENVLF